MNETSVKAAARALRGIEELHVVEVTAHLLRICRAYRHELDATFQQDQAATLIHTTYRPLMSELIAPARDALDPEFLDRDVLEGLANHLDGASSIGDLALRAHDAAAVLDAQRGAYFFAYSAGRRVVLTPGAPVPVTPADVPVEELGTRDGLGPAPDRLEVPRPLEAPLDGTARLRLCPLDLGKLELALDARYHAAIDRLFSGNSVRAPGPETVWAAVVPSCAVLEDLTYDRIDEASPPRFYRVRPKPERAPAYRERVRRGLDLAAAAGARIVVLPELSLDAGIETMLTNWFEQNRSVAMVLAGSRHLDGEGEPRRNRSRMLLRGVPLRETCTHDKFSSFDIVLDGVRRVEDIERPNTLTLYAGRRWSFCPLICKDFMEPVPRRVLVDLRARTVLVAAMSPKTKVFEIDAAEVAQGAQSLVFVVNAPHGSDDAVAILATPFLRDPVVCRTQHRDGLTATVTVKSSFFKVIHLLDGTE